MRYSYAIAEDTAREGYTLHGNHRDDLPVEVITTDASEHGANAGFAGMYSHEIRVSDRALAEPARNRCRRIRQQARIRQTGIRNGSSRTVQKREAFCLAEDHFYIFPVPD